MTFFELITGRVPFLKDSAVDIAVAHVKERFPSVKKYLPNCPTEIEKIINKCVKKNPKDRYASADDLYHDLLEVKKNPKTIKEKKGLFAKIFGFK